MMNIHTAIWRIVRPVLLGVVLVVALLLALTAVGQAQSGGRDEPAPISPHLLERLGRAGGNVTILVILEDQLAPTPVLRSARATGADATARRTALYHALTTHAATTQAPLRAWLDAQGLAYRPYYLVNMIAVEGDLTLARRLAQRPEVNRLAANPEVRQLDGVAAPQAAPWPRLPRAWSPLAEIPYGLINTKAAQVWDLGIRGAGIVVGSQDTGVIWDHPALQEAYRGWSVISGTVDHVYNWADAFGRNAQDLARCAADPQVPCDDNGHGTHTVGTMVGDATPIGDTVIGMAPDAQWIGCRNMRSGVGTPESYTTCFEFFLAPYPQGGDPAEDGRPELGAHVVNNSWGCPPTEGCDFDSLQEIVETVRAAGIVVVASAGNEGSSCSSVRNPIGLYDASLTVGAVDKDNEPAGFSSRGPVSIDGSNRRKPDLAAPGVGVRSAGAGGTVNSHLSGTSMAAPHVAGAIALLWSATPDLIGDVDLTEQILLRSARPNPFTSACDGGGSAWPNNTTGFGSLDVLSAVLMAQQPATVTLQFVTSINTSVTVTDVALVDMTTGYRYPADTIADGQAGWSRVHAGIFRVVGQRSSGQPLETGENVEVQLGATVVQTLTLEMQLWAPLILR